MYTDGSVQNDTGGGSVVSFQDNVESKATLYNFPSHSTILQIECAMLTEAVLKNTEMNTRMYTDSFSTLSGLNSIKPKATIVPLISALHAAQNSIQLIWLPSHSGFAGNERADSLAKSACTNGLPHGKTIVTKNFTSKLLKERMLAEWSASWVKSLQSLSPTTQYFQRLFPNGIEDFRSLWNIKRWTSQLAQIYTGHNNNLLGYFQNKRKKQLVLCDENTI